MNVVFPLLVVKLFDLQEKSFDSPELQSLSRLKSYYRSLHLHNQFKRNNNKIFYQREGAKHIPVYPVLKS